MLMERGVQFSFTHVVAGEKALRRCLKGLLRGGIEVIVVAGGDGTMTTAAGELAKSDAALGVLPMGTGNSFALSLGIPNLETAVDAIVAGHTAQIDLGNVNGTYFANFATIGLSSRIAAATPNRLKKMVGAAAYVLAGIIPGLRSRPFPCEVRAGKLEMEFQTFQVIIANGRYFGRTPLASDASLTSGKLVLYATSDASIADAAKTYAALLVDGGQLLPNAHVLEAPKLRVRTHPKQPVAIDGEICGKTPARFSVEPAALRVIVPAGVENRV